VLQTPAAADEQVDLPELELEGAEPYCPSV
jgi:hypothetical protein